MQNLNNFLSVLLTLFFSLSLWVYLQIVELQSTNAFVALVYIHHS